MPRMLFAICLTICPRVPNFLERVYIQKSLCFTFYLSVNYSFLENQPEVTDQTLHALLYKQYFFQLRLTVYNNFMNSTSSVALVLFNT